MSHFNCVLRITLFLTVIYLSKLDASLPCEGSPEYYDCEIPITDCTPNARSCDMDQCEKFCADLGAVPVPDRCNEYFCVCKPCDANCCWTAVRSALYERENCTGKSISTEESANHKNMTDNEAL